MNITRILFILLISMTLVACAGKKKKSDEILPAEQMYNEAMELLQKKDYKEAIEGFEELERTYPYSKWATKAEIMAAYTNYKNEDYTSSVIVLDKFISLHPGNKDIEYAYYLKAICYYEQISDARRDQSFSLLALDSLKEVVARFPESSYARDAKGKIALVIDRLSGKELTVGRFYLKDRKYIAAINRFKEVLKRYDTTSEVPEALHRLVEANMSLGLVDEAKKYAAILGYNYPDSKWYAYSYELIEGKKLPKESYKETAKQWMKDSFKSLKNPLKMLKRGDDLTDTINTDIEDIESQPVSEDRTVKITDATEEDELELPAKEQPGLFSRIGAWFKEMNVPFKQKK